MLVIMLSVVVEKLRACKFDLLLWKNILLGHVGRSLYSHHRVQCSLSSTTIAERCLVSYL